MSATTYILKLGGKALGEDLLTGQEPEPDVGGAHDQVSTGEGLEYHALAKGPNLQPG